MSVGQGRPRRRPHLSDPRAGREDGRCADGHASFTAAGWARILLLTAYRHHQHRSGDCNV